MCVILICAVVVAIIFIHAINASGLKCKYKLCCPSTNDEKLNMTFDFVNTSIDKIALKIVGYNI